MLYLNLKNLMRLMPLVALFMFVSCTPQASAPNVNTNASTGTNGTNTSGNTYADPSFSFTGIFLQEGITQSATSFSLPADFSDSFLMRGPALSKYLRAVPSSTKFCVAAKFLISSSNEYLILSGKPKSFTDFAAKTTEFYLQFEPANASANLADCSYMNLIVPDLTPSYSFSQLCTTCPTGLTSAGLKLYLASSETPNLNVASLTLTLSGTSSSTGNSCVESITCQSKGYSCCLDSMCVQEAAVRPGSAYSSGYAAAAEEVRLNPSHYIYYPQYYYVCGALPPPEEDDESSTDPDYDATVRVMELQNLYSCLNKVDGEFSYCTKKTVDAHLLSNPFTNPVDDVNFNTIQSNLSTDNIVKVVFAGKTLFENGNFISGVSFGAGNDLLNSGQNLTLTEPVPTGARDKNLYVTYKVDGTCEKISTTLAKCTKTYIFGSTDTSKTTYHNDISKDFLLPSYADLNSSDPAVRAGTSIIVKVGGTTIPEDAANWIRMTGKVRFVKTLYTNQEIEITYFSSQASSLVTSRTEAQAQVNTMCACTGPVKCNLKPVINASTNTIANYECVYPSSTSQEAPVNQTVYVSNKNIAHRYYDQAGLSYDSDYSSAGLQELNEFSYTNSDVLKPNNVGTNVYVGFNEIYGSISKSNNAGPRPAKMAQVKKDKTYDIYVNSGAFSSCLNCGYDYYSSLQKVFPQNFSGKGGGYSPDKYESRREANASVYTSDDMRYGRACFVPATMIPWTHKEASLPKDQRLSRLKGQHLLFANGYSRDWFGFDYGSIIGSFDGVTWFSIGNERRIRATSNKLYLAVNAYFGDLNIDNTFNITVSETNSLTTMPDHDTETDGAECQKSHFCSTDNDCIRQLGYDYSCQAVAGLYTPWPQFDANGNEIVGSVTKTIASIVGGTNGQAKRCVYRGRGAPCLNDLLNASSTTPPTFNGSSLIGTLSCSPNNSCISVNTASRFNKKIARFAASPAAQNAVSADPLITSDTVGLGARMIGRPYQYYGKETISTIVAETALLQNNVASICIPGRNIASSTRTYDMNKLVASQVESSDKLFGVGPTMSGGQSTKYLNACPATDAAGISLHFYDLALGDTTLNMFTTAQNLSSNLLDIAPLNDSTKSNYVFSSISGSPVKTVGYQKNACLRAPGASCFSDMECAPSTFIAGKVRAADFASLILDAEKKYWSEELVCGNPDFKNVNTGLNPNYDIKKNVCCREFGKTMTVYTQTDDVTSPEWCDTSTSKVKVAGVNSPITNSRRYSRVHTGYDKMTCDISEISSTKTFALSTVAVNAVQRMLQIDRQFKTLDAINQRTCCTQNWVRSFHSTDNGGGHQWSKTKVQTIDKEMFKHISWEPQDTTLPVVDSAFECNSSNYSDVSCEIKSLTDAEKTLYLNWASSLELIGIPQVAIKSNDDIYQLVDDNQEDPTDAGPTFTTHTAKKVPLINSIKPVRNTYAYDSGTNTYTLSTLVEDFEDALGKKYYSGSNYNAFELGAGKLKRVFSESEFNCCIPSGQEVPTSTTASQCCTGAMANVNGPLRCCLPDYTDVTLYLNRYVSSEGRGLPDSFYDKNTGYITDPGQVKLMAQNKNLCCSGKAVLGVAISRMSIPVTGGNYLLPASNLNTSERFNYRTDAVDNNTETKAVGSRVDAGVRWNNHVYCVPSNYQE